MKSPSIKILVVLISAIPSFIFAQLNLTLKAHIPYNEASSSCWGYSAHGKEYAIIGVESGTLIYDITNPTNPIKKGFIGGNNSQWREMKVIGEYCYVTSEAGPAIQIISLATLPDTVNWSKNMDFTVPGVSSTYRKGHTITNDENGFLYLNGGGNSTRGASVILDTKPDPTNPTVIGKINGPYCHDSYAIGDRLYASCGGAGVNIYNIAKKDSTYFLANITLNNGYSHNSWTNNSQTHLFTTEEIPVNLPVGSYDIQNLNNIFNVDKFWRNETKNTEVVPHNVHVVGDDFIVTAYYTDGISVIDGKHPDNLIEVAHYDTYLVNEGGYHGVWGVYPYFPSGNLIASDIEGGLWIFTPQYKHACWLEGKVTDSITGALLSDVKVSINHPSVGQRVSNGQGIYKTGIGISGTYSVTYEKSGYFPFQIDVDLFNDSLLTKNVVLRPIQIRANASTLLDPSLKLLYHKDKTVLEYALGADSNSGNLEILSISGVQVGSEILSQNQGYTTIGSDLLPGIYFVKITNQKGKSSTIKLLK